MLVIFCLSILSFVAPAFGDEFSSLNQAESHFLGVDKARFAALDEAELQLRVFLEKNSKRKLSQRELKKIFLFASHTLMKEPSMAYKFGILIVPFYLRQEEELKELLPKLLPPGDALEMQRQLDQALKELKEGNG